MRPLALGFVVAASVGCSHPVVKSVVETIRASAREVQLLDSAAHSWNLGDTGLDAALLVGVHEFVVNRSPRRNVVGAEFEGEAELALSVVAVTGNGREVRKTMGATAAEKAVDRWGFGGCAQGVLPAARAAERAIRHAMTQHAEWIAVAPELRGSPVH